MIEVHSFGYRYPGAARPAVHDVSFSVQQGEIFGFSGPSGAGKSTTQNVLIRLLAGSDGEPFRIHLIIGCVTASVAVVIAARVFDRRLLTRA